MTNEKAISIIKNAFSWYEDNARESEEEDWSEQHEALRMAIQALEQQPSEDCISRKMAVKAVAEALKNVFVEYEDIAEGIIGNLPSVTPKYTDEEIDRAQAVEQAYVDKMVELAVEETKERYSDAIKKMRKTIDEMTEIHSDGEFYIKNVDAKWIISKYLCSAKERPKGRWIATENEEMNIVGYYCSCCDLPMETEKRTKYCPNCGSYNGGGEDADSN